MPDGGTPPITPAVMRKNAADRAARYRGTPAAASRWQWHRSRHGPVSDGLILQPVAAEQTGLKRQPCHDRAVREMSQATVN